MDSNHEYASYESSLSPAVKQEGIEREGTQTSLSIDEVTTLLIETVQPQHVVDSIAALRVAEQQSVLPDGDKGLACHDVRIGEPLVRDGAEDITFRCEAPPRKKQKQSPEYRRPQLATKYYSAKSAEATWAGLPEKKKRDLTHVGYIEEKCDGVLAAAPCERCVKKRFERCLVYKKESRAKYHPKGVGYSCSRCRFDGQGCSLQADAKAADAAEAEAALPPEDMSKETLVFKHNNMVAAIAALTKENDALAAMVAWYDGQTADDFCGFD